MFIAIHVLYTVYSERRILDVVLVPGCLFDISSHKVSPNSKGWASLKKPANLKITVPIRLTWKMWTLIRRRWYLGIYSQTLYVLFRDRWAYASKNKNNVVFIDFKCKGVPRSLSPAHFAFVQCSPIFQKKKKTKSVNRLKDKGKQHVQFLRH